ncbi:2-methylisocitrate lyase [Microvirga sp. KLBC 81]|uniref:isocitrate lyase/PEP mutase family protein n=1 Tax=Microvirga sp. KLBC 81 TaxID=1862707 RepID=UPI000D52517A|nr:isocitrate lyase/PEP mutase family protein [Microvirga sp. KLBC 81]PVE25795.1 2-methylisocitrate lyase [Microvirga sp. KLBC 81]
MTLSRRPPLLELLNQQGTLFIPGCYDALSARLVELAGFKLAYVGSYATAASGFALPDVGALTLDDLARHAKTVTDAVNVPVVADAEGGFFAPANIWRTIHAFEDAGVSAIHIEDHAGGKHTNLPQELIPLEDMLQRLRAALEARRDPNFQIIARTDAIWAKGDVGEAIRRLRAFSELGIELVFPTGATPEMLRAVRTEVPDSRIVVIDLPEVQQVGEWNGLADLVINYGFCLYAASKGVRDALAELGKHQSVPKLTNLLEDPVQFEQRLGYDTFTARSIQYQAHSK